MSGSLAYARLLASLGVLAVVAGGCGSSAHPSSSEQVRRVALAHYMRAVEPLRLGVNRLLEGADPILSGYHDGRLPARRASLAMGALERRFAAYATDVAAIRPATLTLRRLHAIYAHTYVLEDSYLSALTTGLAERDLNSASLGWWCA